MSLKKEDLQEGGFQARQVDLPGVAEAMARLHRGQVHITTSRGAELGTTLQVSVDFVRIYGQTQTETMVRLMSTAYHVLAGVGAAWQRLPMINDNYEVGSGSL